MDLRSGLSLPSNYAQLLPFYRHPIPDFEEKYQVPRMYPFAQYAGARRILRGWRAYRARQYRPYYQARRRPYYIPSRTFKKSRPKRPKYATMIRGRPIPSFNHFERAYIETVTNPFGHTEDGIGLPRGGRIPDSSGINTIPATLTANMTITGGAALTEGLIKICKLNDTRTVGIWNTYSVGGLATPTAEQTTTFHQIAQLDPMVNRFRIVGMALKCFAISPPDVTSGALQGGNCSEKLKTGAAAYTAYANAAAETEVERLPVKKGMTVRWSPGDLGDCLFTKWAVRADHEDTDWRAPTIYFQGLAVGTVLEVMAIVHIEVEAGMVETPFPLTPSPVSDKWSLLYSIVTHPDFAPIVTEGASFKSFFSNIGKFFGKVGKWLFKHRGHILPVATHIGKMLS